MSEPPEFWAVLASLIGVIGIFGRLLVKKGCFVVSPCGQAHVCVFDTKSNPETMKAFVQHLAAEHAWEETKMDIEAHG